MPVNKTEPRRVLGPNMKVLVSKVAAGFAARDGAKTPGDYIETLKDPKKHISLANRAIYFCDAAIQTMRIAPDNVWGTDEEVLAGVVLQKMEERGLK